MKLITRIKKLLSKTSSTNKEEEEVSWLKLLWQQIFGRLMRTLKRQKKLDNISTTNLQPNDEEIATIELGKSLSKRKERIKELKKKKLKSKEAKKRKNREISEVLKDYQQLLEEDFIVILKKANSFLRDLKSSVMELISQRNISINSITEVNQDLEDIASVYILAESMMNSLLDNCHNYRETIIDARRMGSREQKLHTAQTQLEKVMKKLQDGQKMADIKQNKDYKHITSYLEKNNTISLSR